MFHKGNGSNFKKFAIKIGAVLFVWITGIAILASLGLYALITLLLGSAFASI